jgi:hypothetical protein
MKFTTHTMQELLPLLENSLKTNNKIRFGVLNPDEANVYAGATVVIGDTSYLYRGYKAWTDLAELLGCRMLTPKNSVHPFVTLTFEKLSSNSFHTDTYESKEEKYGVSSIFNRIRKMEEPAFLYYYSQALDNVNIQNKMTILNLGINTGDEFSVIKNKLDTNSYEKKMFVGIDHSNTAIAYAKEKFIENNVMLLTEDINDIDALGLAKFDLLISIGTLQSPSINFKPFFMHLVQNYLEKDAAIILGFPNSRWVGGEMIYGAKAPNYVMSEQSLLYNDVIFCKKYLQQKKYRVTLTGKQYVFLTATRISS